MNDKSLLKIFGIFAKIGAFTIGGGYAMIPLIEAELRRRDWIGEDEMPDIIVLAQSAPGLLAVNMAIFAGYRLRGLKGSIAATLGAVLPSFVAILAIAMAFNAVCDNPWVIRFFKGLRPVAVALILVPMVRMARKGCTHAWHWAVLAATLFAVAFLKISPIYILLTVIVVACAAVKAGEGRKR